MERSQENRPDVLRWRNNAPSIGVPMRRENPTIENANPIRVLQKSISQLYTGNGALTEFITHVLPNLYSTVQAMTEQETRLYILEFSDNGKQSMAKEETDMNQTKSRTIFRTL